MTANWQGVMPALMTGMKQDGALDLEATARHVETCLGAGCSGFIMLGTLGENSSLTLDEKEAVVRTAKEAVGGRVPVLAGVAEYTTPFAVEIARRMARAGADGLMALPCLVHRLDGREAVRHFRDLARASDLPIRIYNNPVSYQVDLLPEHFEELAEVEDIVAVKESSHDSRRITAMVNRIGDRNRIFCGVDDLVLENVLFGAAGWVSDMANCLPAESVRLFELGRDGKLDQALALYRWFMPVLHLDTHVKLVQYIKLANQLTGYGAEWVRAPRLLLEGAERAEVEVIVRAAIASRPELHKAA